MFVNVQDHGFIRLFRLIWGDNLQRHITSITPAFPARTKRVTARRKAQSILEMRFRVGLVNRVVNREGSFTLRIYPTVIWNSTETSQKKVKLAMEGSVS